MLSTYRRTHEALLGGVLAGIAHRFKINKSLLRVLFFLAFVLLSFLPAIGLSASVAPVLIYLLLWLSMPAPERELNDEEQDLKAGKIKIFYNYTMLGIGVNLVPLLALALFAPERLVFLLMTVPSFFLLLPATLFIITGIIKAG